jgi:hypothetical protein
MIKRVISVDASALKNASCMLSFYRTVVDGYRTEINNNSIEFGSAVHLFLKVMCDTDGNFAEGIKAARGYFETKKMTINFQKKYLDVLYLQKVCIDYWQWLCENNSFQILAPEGKPAVEITFSNKYYEDDELIINLEGTIDKIGQFNGGCYAIGDYKTTSSRDIELYFAGYELSTQLKFYIYNLKRYAKDNPSSLIAEVCKHKVGAFIDGVFLNGKDHYEFGRSNIFIYKDEELELYERLLGIKLQQLIDHIKSNELPDPEGMLTDTCTKPENSTNGAWRCRFWHACKTHDPRIVQHILNNDFVKKDYRPLMFGKS